MARINPAANRYTVSPLGAFLVGLFLGGGILFIYHAKAFNDMSREVEKLRQDTARLEKVRGELNALLSRLEVLEKGRASPAPPSKQE
jgi:hypothetical protein